MYPQDPVEPTFRFAGPQPPLTDSPEPAWNPPKEPEWNEPRDPQTRETGSSGEMPDQSKPGQPCNCPQTPTSFPGIIIK